MTQPGDNEWEWRAELRAWKKDWPGKGGSLRMLVMPTDNPMIWTWTVDEACGEPSLRKALEVNVSGSEWHAKDKALESARQIFRDGLMQELKRCRS